MAWDYVRLRLTTDECDRMAGRKVRGNIAKRLINRAQTVRTFQVTKPKRQKGRPVGLPFWKRFSAGYAIVAEFRRRRESAMTPNRPAPSRNKAEGSGVVTFVAVPPAT